MLATVTEVMQAEAHADLQKLLADALNQVSAANVLAEAAARAKAEALVTKAGEWASERIRQAGESVVTRIEAERRVLQGEAAAIGLRIKWATCAALVCSLAALAATAGTVMAIAPWH